MRWEPSDRFVFRAGVIAGGVALLALLLLVGDWALATARAPEEGRRVDELREAVRTDFEVAQQLEAEREQQTAASLRRKGRARVLAWVLLVCGSVFVAANWPATGLLRREAFLAPVVTCNAA